MSCSNKVPYQLPCPPGKNMNGVIPEETDEASMNTM